MPFFSVPFERYECCDVCKLLFHTKMESEMKTSVCSSILVLKMLHVAEGDFCRMQALVAAVQAENKIIQFVARHRHQ